MTARGSAPLLLWRATAPEINMLAHRKRECARISRQLSLSEFLKLRCAEVGMKAFAVDRYSAERLEVNIPGDGIVLISLVSFQIAEVDILDGRQGKVF